VHHRSVEVALTRVNTQHRNGRSVRGKRITKSLVALALTALATSVGGPTAGRADTTVSFHVDRHWLLSTVPTGNTAAGITGWSTVFVDAPGRAIYAVSLSGTWLAAYNADTLAPMGGGLTTDAITAAIPDPRGGQIITGTLSSSNIPTIETFAVGSKGVQKGPSAALPTLAGQILLGLAPADGGRTLYALSAQYDDVMVPNSVQVAKIDVSSLGSGTATVVWNLALPNCFDPIATTPQEGLYSLGNSQGKGVPAAAIGYASIDHSLYFGCTAPATSLPAPQRTPLPGGAAQLQLPTDGTNPSAANLRVFDRAGNFQDSFWDAPSQRMVLTSGAERTSIDVFDAASHTYVGDIDAGGNTLAGAGINEATGQVYALSNGSQWGMEAAFIRPTPPTQAWDFPALKPAVQQFSPLTVDSLTGRVFIPEHTSTTLPTTDMLVIRYDGTGYAQPAAPNPDSNTTNVVETPGVTGHTYSGSVEGYGAVERWVGGADASLNDLTFFNTQGETPFGPGTRELRLAYINNLSLGLSEADASSIAADRDEGNTGRDQATACGAAGQVPAPPQPPSPAPSAPAPQASCSWPYHAAFCSNYAGAAQQVDEPGGSGSASSLCDAESRLVTTKATFQSGQTLNLTVKNASTQGSISVDNSNGLVSKVTSVAQGVDLLNGAVRIGKITTTAASHAFGRPSTAGSTYGVTLENVVIQGTDVCTTNCDIATVAAEINSQFSDLMRVDFPHPDSTLAAGSAGGYQAVVRRPLQQQLEEQLLDDQIPDRTEVPGMVVTVYMGDSEKPARLVTYLAGVETEAHYGIYTLGSDDSGSSFTDSSPAVQALLNGGSGSSYTGGGTGSGGNPPAPLSQGKTPPTTSNPLGFLLPPGGWRWLAEHPADAVKLLFLWCVLLSPIYVAARRWLLIQRNRVLQEALA
jgi:hypothetical protein